MTARRSTPRSFALALALAAGGTGLLAGPAHAAPTPTATSSSAAPTAGPTSSATATSRPTSTTSSSSSPTSEATDDDATASSSFDPDAAAPKAADSDDQNALEKAWAAIKSLVTGDDDKKNEPAAPAKDDSPTSGAAGDVAVLPAASNNRTLTAEGFVNSVGVGTHLAYLDTSYGHVDAVKLVEDLGVLHVREGLGSADGAPIASMKRLGQAGVDVNWVAQPDSSPFSVDDQLKVIKDNDLPVTSVEGENEADNRGDGAWVGKVRAHQATLYAAVKATLGANVAVIAPSLVHDESRAQLGEVPSDVANSHPYTGGEMQTVEQTEHQLSMAREVTPTVDTTTPAQVEGKKVDLKTAVEDSGAMWATETGFHTATGSTAGNGVQPYVSEKAQAVLETQQVLANYRNGIDRSYIYELLDEGGDNAQAEDRFGLAHADGSPKPVYTALQQLLATVKNGGPAPTAGAAPVAVKVTGGSDVTTSVVLPRADGSTVVAIWEASPVWDRDASRDLDVPAHDVTLTLGGAADAQVFVPGQGTKALDAQDGTSSVKVKSQAAPTIVVLTPTGSSPQTATPTSPEHSSTGPTSSSDERDLPGTQQTSQQPTPTSLATMHPLDTAGPEVDEEAAAGQR